ncbi:phage N-6-adenine-methyltransferase [Aeromonas veronii]|uniref:phage N-6-adenine-methyltransferase n=1 Tax=Aeromonas veronii TaxID=654 RepID=UPI003F7A33E6
MNHYAQALAELQLQPDHELKQIGDQWQTPRPLAWGLFHYFAPTLGPVVLDMFADDCNTLLPNYYDAKDNALIQDLAADLRRLGGAAFANPPYSRPCVDSDGNAITGMESILNFCREQRALGAKIMLLIKAATSETWWPEDADFIQFISGRIGFEVPNWYVPRDPKKDKPSSSGFASAVVIFDASWQGERRPEARLRRDYLITTGQIILDMIHRQAVALNEEASQEIAKAVVSHHIADASNMVSESELASNPCQLPDSSILPAMLQDQPAVAKPAEWEPPVATDNQANQAAAQELALLEIGEDKHAEQVEQVTTIGTHHPDYAEPGLYLVRYVDEVAELSDADQNTLRSYLKGWFDEGESPSEICYRLTLAAANLKAGKQAHDGFVLHGRTPTLPHWQRHPAVKAVIYQIDDADILTPAKTSELAGWIIDNLSDDDDLLEMATAKAADLLAASKEPTPNHTEHQLDMLEQMTVEQVDEEPVTSRTVQEMIFEFDNNELPVSDWRAFIAVLASLYPRTVGEAHAEHDRFTNAQIRFALCQCDDDEEGVTDVPQATTMTINLVLGDLERIDKQLALSKEEMYLAAAHQAKVITNCINNSSANLKPAELRQETIDIINDRRELQQEEVA